MHDRLFLTLKVPSKKKFMLQAIPCIVFLRANQNFLVPSTRKHKKTVERYRNSFVTHTYIEGVSPDCLQGCIRIMKADTGKKKKNPIPTGALAALIKQRCVVHKRLSS